MKRLLVILLAFGLLAGTAWGESFGSWSNSNSKIKKTRIGVGPNYTKIDSKGKIDLFGDARYRTGFWLDASGIGKNPNKKPVAVKHGQGVALEFTDNNDLEGLFNFRLPSSMDSGEDMTLSIGWSSPAVDKNCAWTIVYNFTALGEATDLTGTTQNVYAPCADGANELVVTTFTIPAANYDSDDICGHFTIERRGGVENDTLAASAFLPGICVQIMSDKLTGLNR